MSAEIKKFYPKDAAKNPDAVFEQAIGNYESALVLGYDKEGRLDVRSSTNLDCKELLWLIEMFKMKMLRGDYFEEDLQ